MNKKYLYIALVIIIIASAILLSQKKVPTISAEYISTDVARLVSSKPTETVELKDGDKYNLTAGYIKKSINGTEYRMLAYNGSIPGPLIKVSEGSEVTINFKNDTDMSTLLHSHGVRMDNAFDGSQATQKEIKPGETFAYNLKFPDAGMYWYHPHVREDLQQELGLYGNYLVTPSNSSYWSPVDREIPLFLDDLLIENTKISLNKNQVDRTLMGRFGNVQLINGETDYKLSVKKGEVVRFYITSAANARPYNFMLEGMQMKLVGSDSGAYEKDKWTESILLGPSERVIVEVLFDKSGNYDIQNKTPDKTYALGSVTVSEEIATSSTATSFPLLKSRDEIIKSINPFRSYFTKAPDKRLRLSVEMTAEMQNMMGGDMSAMEGMNMTELPQDGIEWEEGDSEMMNRMSNTENVKWSMIDETTGNKNVDINWEFTKGQAVKIRITNDAKSMHPMQHPIHFHGQRFLIVNKNGVAQTNLSWEDTVTVPAGQYVDIVLDTSNPGTWLAHCHIPEHMEAGMMMGFTIK